MLITAYFTLRWIFVKQNNFDRFDNNYQRVRVDTSVTNELLLFENMIMNTIYSKIRT
jgi:aminopeptidase-like protein